MTKPIDDASRLRRFVDDARAAAGLPPVTEWDPSEGLELVARIRELAEGVAPALTQRDEALARARQSEAVAYAETRERARLAESIQDAGKFADAVIADAVRRGHLARTDAARLADAADEAVARVKAAHTPRRLRRTVREALDELAGMAAAVRRRLPEFP